MIKTYLVVLGTKYDRDKVKEIFNKNPNINFWFINLPYTIFINTSLTPKSIMESLESELGEDRILITEVAKNKYGRLPKDHWDYFK